jgi:hypothetical protein
MERVEMEVAKSEMKERKDRRVLPQTIEQRKGVDTRALPVTASPRKWTLKP